MNVQDLASLSDQIWQLTGLRVRETVPDWLFQQADEVVIADVTPRALLHRLERGAIFSPDKAKSDSARLFKEPVLVALRELAIRQTAQVLDARQTGKGKAWIGGKILVNVTATPRPPCCCAGRSGWPTICRPSALQCTSTPKRSLAAVHVEDRPTVDRHLRFAENLHISTEVIHGNNRAQTLVDYGHERTASPNFFESQPESPSGLVSRPGLH